jgi:integrase
MARLLYGTGLRVMEGLRLRVKDVDFERGQIIVHEGKEKREAFTYRVEHRSPMFCRIQVCRLLFSPAPMVFE